MPPRRVTLITAAGLLALLGLVLFTAPRWTRLMTRTVPGEEADEPAAATEVPGEPAADAQGQITVKLFFHATDRDGLLIEERAVPYSADLATQVRTVVEELVKGPRDGLAPTLAPDTRVLEVFVSPGGVAYVDLSKEATASPGGGSGAELMTVYSIVNSVTANFPAVKRVQILIDDRLTSTFAGHVDLMRPLRPDMQWLATNVGPSPSPSAPAPPAATPPSP